MSDRFAEFDLTAWTEDDVLVLRKLPRVVERKPMLRESPWSSKVALSFFGLAGLAGLQFSAATMVNAYVIVDHQEVTADIRMRTAGPGRDVVPQNYWQNLTRVARSMPALADDSDVDTYDEPFI